MKNLTTKRGLRCAIYTRVSTDQGLEQDFNLRRMMRRAPRFELSRSSKGQTRSGRSYPNPCALLRAWQTARLARSHRDLLESRRFHAAADFFLTDLYVRIPRQSGRGFRFDVGHRSDLIPATIPK